VLTESRGTDEHLLVRDDGKRWGHSYRDELVRNAAITAELPAGVCSTRTVGQGQHAVKVRDVIRFIEKDGWRNDRTKGSHRQFRHSVKPGTVTVSGNLGVGVPIGTLNSSLKERSDGIFGRR
jgi:predicted RNA binding protein YcfA (HicA-like mRNA interferase family)